MRSALFFVAAVFLSGVPAIHADTLQLSVTSSVLASFYSPDSNFYGTYDSRNAQITDFPTFLNEIVSTSFSNVSVSVPTGSVITSAVILVEPSLVASHGTGVIYLEPGFINDLPDPHVAPTFGSDGTSTVFSQTYEDFFAPIINGDQVSTGDLEISLSLSGQIQDTLESPGENFVTYLGGNGEAVVPYTVDLDVTYSPVPEPSSFALLGTGILGLVGVVRRKLAMR